MISTDSAVHHTPMNHELPESKNLSPDNKEHAGLMKPTVVASIFTKEGLQKIKEQQAAAKSKNSRKKPSASTSNVATSEPSVETPEATPAPKTRKPRAKASNTSTASTPTTSAAKPKRKKKTANDEDSDYKISGSSKGSKSSKTVLKADGVGPSVQETTSGGSQCSTDNNLEENNSDGAIDPNHSRRKRRKKAAQNEEVQIITIVDDQPEDIPMGEAPSTTGIAREGSVAISDSRRAEEAIVEKNTASPTLTSTCPKKDIPVQKNTIKGPAKAVHPFFAPGGSKKPEAKTHPFFAPGGMKKVAPPPMKAEDSKEIASVGLAPLRERRSTPPPRSLDSMGASIGLNRSLLLSPTSNRLFKIPGLMDAPWPNKEQCHVRDLSPSDNAPPKAKISKIKRRVERKLKDISVEVNAQEDLLAGLARNFRIGEYGGRISSPTYREDEYFRVSSTLRLPAKVVMTGPELQEVVRRRTVARLPHPDAPPIQQMREVSVSSADSGMESKMEQVHPVIRRIYNELHDGLSPFDQGQHETFMWTAKYAPESSQEVLQVGREMGILRDWLIKLMVESGGSEVDKKKKRRRKGKDEGPGTKKGKAKKKKKRNKGDGLDDFLVESDQERDEMDEITDVEDERGWSSSRNIYGASTKKSTIRTGDKIAGLAAELGFNPSGGASASRDKGKMVNAVVISGPSGCGKTAAVYAVAQEMGYTVFEVSPGTRRSGKDLLDQVGEMSKNHLVHSSKTAAAPATTSFFKLKHQEVQQVVEKARQFEDKANSQSLILLEEVDLLYEEDKQFWPTVMTLMGQSKRPIVMTCNDESILPLDTISLHAILRFTPPPEDLTIDYLLLLAANEGHLVARDAVRALYRSLKGDLRAAITELNFWCQMGVGDRRAGLDWILQRFPVGCDLNDKGDQKRVISDNTYVKGIGWVPREEDVGILGENKSRLDEYEMWRSLWDEWEIDVGSDGVSTRRGMDGWAQELVDKEQVMQHMALDAYQFYVEALSDVDIYAGRGMRSAECPLLDTTQPPASAYVRNDDLQGYPLIDASPVNTSYSLDTLISATVRSLARSYLGSETNGLLTDPEDNGIHSFDEPQLIETISSRAEISQSTRSVHPAFLHEAFIPISQSTTSLPSSSTFATTPATHTFLHAPLPTLTTDIAPYIRSIIRHDQTREAARLKASTLLSAGGHGKPSKRRSTRSARLALEGGSRGAGRRAEKYFARGNFREILATGGERWGELVEDVLERMMQEVRMEEYECEAEIDDDAGMETGGSSEGNTPAGEHSMRG